MSRAPKHRDAIVEAAVRLFRRQGYAATGLNEIVAASGAPKGSLYHYFPAGKAAIGEAAVALAGERVRCTLIGLVAQNGSAASVLRQYGQLMAGWMKASGFRDGCPIATTLLETAPQDSRIATSGAAAFASWRSVLEEQLNASVGSSERARSLATLAISAIEGALIQARACANAQPIIDTTEALAQLIDDCPPATLPL